MNKLLFLLLLLTNMTFAADPLNLSGTYVVPVTDDTLKQYSQTEVGNINFEMDSFSFTLPSEIASENAEAVKFVRDMSDPNTFRSVFGMATCLQNTMTTVSCSVEYNRIYGHFLEQNLGKTEEFLKAQNLPAAELEGRLNVALLFSGNPIGFLIINLPVD